MRGEKGVWEGRDWGDCCGEEFERGWVIGGVRGGKWLVGEEDCSWNCMVGIGFSAFDVRYKQVVQSLYASSFMSS